MGDSDKSIAIQLGLLERYDIMHEEWFCDLFFSVPFVCCNSWCVCVSGCYVLTLLLAVLRATVPGDFIALFAYRWKGLRPRLKPERGLGSHGPGTNVIIMVFAFRAEVCFKRAISKCCTEHIIFTVFFWIPHDFVCAG